MQRNAWKYIANWHWQTKQLNSFSKSQLHAWVIIKTKEEMGTVGELSKACSQIVMKCLHWARIGRLDILWSVNKLARAITEWTRACDER